MAVDELVSLDTSNITFVSVHEQVMFICIATHKKP